MTKLTAILDAQAEARQMTIDEYLALDRDGNPPGGIPSVEIVSLEDVPVATERAEIGRLSHCEVEDICHAALNISGNYTCGWIGAGTVGWCAKRKRYLRGNVK